MKIPCKDCICIPMCRHKNYNKLMIDCTTLFELLYVEAKGVIKLNGNSNEFEEAILKVQEYIQPITWSTTNNGLVTHIGN